MSENKKTNKATEYPVIYSYIYERESQDIRRLAGNFKTTTRTTRTPRNKSNSTRIISGFKIEDGKAVPIYSDKPSIIGNDDMSKQKSGVVVKKSGVVKENSQKTRRKGSTSTKRLNKGSSEEQ